ncbi:kinase-like domain-containing protein [Collybia nuda]|uniref:Kinase-like domain-containing protein n=1 Tax=Collybia nuda TaxID=64659 RepID=A0A9P5XT74_9AGAR|nr:kinase-like domain-containing protein [Collybia nuda]
MAPGGAKRYASRSPSRERSLKRLATSSPEEGELDDVTTTTIVPGPTTLSLPASLPPKPVTFSKSKVPFPFKRKDSARNGSTSLDPKEPAVAVYERSAEDERRFRDGDHKRKGGRGSKLPGADHWEPGYARGEGMSSRNHGSWREYPNRDRRDRDRKSPSPYSTSRSPISPPSSHHREKHRLPAPRSPEANFSPPRRDYGIDRIRDRERDRGSAWDRDRRYRDDDDDRRQLDRPISDIVDRYYRPERAPYPPNGHRRGGDDREWTRRDEGDRRGGRRDDRAQDYDRDYDHNRQLNSYRPSSPGPPPGPPTRTGPMSPPLPPPPIPPPPRKVPARPQPNKSDRTPPPPSCSPPPPPPPDARLSKDESLPTKHALVSIPMKRPAAPLDAHSPPSMPLPKVKEAEAPPEKKEESKEAEAPKPRPVRRREPVKRTGKEEVEAYGHGFVGCGLQSDYEVTTKLGEGTFGEVHKAIHKGTGRVVALKRILMHNEKEGMPVTALREIKILKALNNPCIVEILDMFVVRSSSKDPLSVYMVFPYMDHDLAGLLENERVKLQPSHIKLYMKQLLEGTEYMHRNHILHRDMKAANLLISNSGSLKIADFGLARAFDANITRGANDSRGKERKYTNCVVTRWYRPPELLLGARQYGGEVDLWGIGCVLGEMFSRRPILPGNSDLDQLEKIWQLCGTPNQHTWPNYDALPGCEGVIRFNTNHSRKLKQTYESVGPETCDLLDKLLTCNPRERITAAQALDHEYFWTDPLPADPKTLPSYEASHEFDKRGHRNPHPPPGGPPIAPQMDGRGGHPPPYPHMHGGGGGRGLPGPGYQNRGPPPNRDMFHQGPPFRVPPPGVPPLPSGYNGPPMNSMHPPHHPPPPYGRNGPYQGGGRGPPYPPYSRPGPGPRNDRNDRWEPRPRPMGLPPRPQGPPTRGRPPSPKGSEAPGRGGSSTLNYG